MYLLEFELSTKDEGCLGNIFSSFYLEKILHVLNLVTSYFGKDKVDDESEIKILCL